MLDLGCGYCEFINALQCGKKIAMDLNPDAERYASSEVSVLQQNCAQPWGVPSESLDVVFSSNFFEHLPSKPDLEQTLGEAHRALRRGGRLIAMGPNIKYLPGKYWDLFDHYLPLTELSLSEVLKKCGFTIEYCRDRFLPYTMSNRREYPTWTLQAYLEPASGLALLWKAVPGGCKQALRNTSLELKGLALRACVRTVPSLVCCLLLPAACNWALSGNCR